MTTIIKELQEIQKLLSLKKEVLTLEEFCLYAGISKHQAYHLTSTKKIKFYRTFGKKIYFNTEDVIELLKSNPVAENKTKEKYLHKQLLNQSI